MIALEAFYLVPPALLARDLREAALNIGFLSVFRSLYLSYEKFALGENLFYEGYFRGLVLVSSIFMLFYYGLPKRNSAIALALFSGYLGIYPRYIAASVIPIAYFLRSFLHKIIDEPLVNALLTGSPMLVSLIPLLSDPYTIAATILLFYYFLLLLIPVRRIEFMYSRLILSLALAIYLFEVLPSGYYIIAKALVRPALIGSEAIRFSIVTRRQELFALYIATYGLTLYTLYGEPLKIFLIGIAIFVSAIVATAILQEFISDL